MAFPYVADAVRQEILALHRTWFDIATGQVLVRTPAGYVDAVELPISSAA
jgi:hypothetical protein